MVNRSLIPDPLRSSVAAVLLFTDEYRPLAAKLKTSSVCSSVRKMIPSSDCTSERSWENLKFLPTVPSLVVSAGSRFRYSRPNAKFPSPIASLNSSGKLKSSWPPFRMTGLPFKAALFDLETFGLVAFLHGDFFVGGPLWRQYGDEELMLFSR